MENYKERYDHALETVQEILSSGADAIRIKTLKRRLQSVFPELKEKESENERIKKTLKGFVKGYSAFINGQWRLGDFTVNRLIDWLEKHNEYSWKPTEEQIEALDYAYNNCPDSERGNYYESVLANLIADLYKLYEKQGEKKPIFNADDWYVSEVDGKIHNAKFIEKQDEEKPTDKVVPKFKPGDWIIFNGLILHIDEVVNGYYRTTLIGDGIHNSYDWDIDNTARLWTIQEAKDGDVLASL